jgi:pyridoxine 5-phosphate synthase
VEAYKIEIHTGAYANARSEQEQLELLEAVRAAAQKARGLGMGVNAGHGLNYLNIIPFRSIEEIEEVSIGHSIISRAVFVGMDRAVREMIELVR